MTQMKFDGEMEEYVQKARAIDAGGIPNPNMTAKRLALTDGWRSATISIDE
jgi:hypothetical protein